MPRLDLDNAVLIKPMTIQVYWPSDLLGCTRYPHKNAVVLGSPITDSTFVVITLLHFSSSIDELESTGLIRNKDGQYAFKDLELSIVGTLGSELDSTLLHFQIINNRLQSPNAMIIVYQPPLPTMLQYYSSTPIPISLTDRSLSDVCADKFVELLNGYHDREITFQEETFSVSVDSLNTCWVKRSELLKLYPQAELAWEPSGILKRGFLALQGWFGWIFSKSYITFLNPTIRFTLYSVIGIRHIMLIILRVLNFKIANNFPSLVELSATAQQIDLRLQQFCYFPIQYVKTTRKFRSKEENAKGLPIEEYPEYIRFYNTLWLIINDVSMGIIIGALLNENKEIITDFFQNIVIFKFLYTDLGSLSSWLMSSPGGIKLNNELSAFLSDLFRWIIEFWNITLIRPLTPLLSYIISFIALSSTFGATFSIAIFSDFLSLITFHIYCFYFASARIFNWQMNIILSLFYLFYGKKRNVLRNRIDSNHYELDQLFLGTLMFIVLMFLLPTVLAFYVTFTVTELSIFIIVGSFEITTALLNHFPIFVLLLRLKDHKRIPGGVKFVNKDGYINIMNKPISISQMFNPFNNVLQKLKSSYLSKDRLTGIIKGHPIHVQRNKLYRLLYSALPSKLISTADLWDELKDEF